MEELKNFRNTDREEGFVDYSNIEPRTYQLWSEDALKLDIIDLFKDEDSNGHKYLSRADLILIFTLYKDGIDGFYKEYMNYIKVLIEEKGYRVVIKPHYYLKNLIG